MTFPALAYDPGSYRDRHARVFYQEGEVLRGLGPLALDAWRTVSAAPFFNELVAESKIVATEEIPNEDRAWAAVLRHARVPVISYPYEWAFSMLRAAAQLQIEIMRRALDDRIGLRDATPFNFQWIGHRPIFIDVVSFTPFVEGALWTGYRQFCELFLFPLFLQAYRGVEFHPWLRGNLDGIPADQMARLLSVRDRLRRGVLTHVDLQANLQKRYRAEGSRNVGQSVRMTGAESRAIIERNLAGLERLIEGLRWEPPGGGWEEYERRNTYTDEDRERKESFVRRWSAATRPTLTLDIGCNTGAFSRIAAESSDYVVAVDSDHNVIENLYRHLVETNSSKKILPLVWDAANPSPGLGWNGLERGELRTRVQPGLVLALAVIHHLVIGRNVPTGQAVEFFASFRSPLIIEFVDRHDPMAQRLLGQKDEEFEDYTAGSFEAALERHFDIVAREMLPSGSRTLFFARPR